MHLQVAKDQGFTAIAEVDILDADGSSSLKVEGGTHLTEDLVGSHFANYDSYLVLSHFKGHQMGGYGGAIKNTAFMITGPATKITNVGAVKIVLGTRRFGLYLVYVMVFALLSGVIINFVL